MIYQYIHTMGQLINNTKSFDLTMSLTRCLLCLRSNIHKVTKYELSLAYFLTLNLLLAKIK